MRGEFGRRFEEIKRSASREDLYRFLYAMPKGGDLHHHHGGASFPDQIHRIATDQGVTGGRRYFTRYRIGNCPAIEDAPPRLRSAPSDLIYWVNIREAEWRALPACNREEYKALDDLSEKELEAWKSSIVLDQPKEGAKEFFEFHWPRISQILGDPYVMSEMLVENMKSMGAEGVLYLEPQVFPWGSRDGDGNPLTAHQVYEIYRARLASEDARATGVAVRFLDVVLRFHPRATELIVPSFRFIHEHRDLWRGINMAGREDNERGHPKRFTAAFDEALRRFPGVGIAIHAGEENEPSRHIFDTLRLGATRIGHGINLLDDPRVMQLMRCGRFLVEINLVSNDLLGYVEDPGEHPFPIYLRQGIPCCLGTDDRGMWDSNFTDEYFFAVTRFNLSWEEIRAMGRNSLRFSFAEEGLKSGLLDLYETRMSAFETRFGVGGDDWEREVASVNAVTHGYGRRQFGITL